MLRLSNQVVGESGVRPEQEVPERYGYLAAGGRSGLGNGDRATLPHHIEQIATFCAESRGEHVEG
jgi:hypothetical protein